MKSKKIQYGFLIKSAAVIAVVLGFLSLIGVTISTKKVLLVAGVTIAFFLLFNLIKKAIKLILWTLLIGCVLSAIYIAIQIGVGSEETASNYSIDLAGIDTVKVELPLLRGDVRIRGTQEKNIFFTTSTPGTSQIVFEKSAGRLSTAIVNATHNGSLASHLAFQNATILLPRNPKYSIDATFWGRSSLELDETQVEELKMLLFKGSHNLSLGEYSTTADITSIESTISIKPHPDTTLQLVVLGQFNTIELDGFEKISSPLEALALLGRTEVLAPGAGVYVSSNSNKGVQQEVTIIGFGSTIRSKISE